MTNELIAASSLREKPLPLRLALPYSAGQVVDSALTNALGTFLLFYVTAVCGLGPGLAGVALGIGLVLDAVLDPVIGSVSDSLTSRLGRRLPFMLIGLPLTTVAFILIFSIPKGLTQPELFAWVALLSIAIRASESLFNLPFQAVGAELTDDHAGRGALMAWKFGVGTAGGIAVVALGFGVFFTGDNGLSRHESYFPFAVSSSLVFLLAGLLACWSVFVTQDRQHPPTTTEKGFLRRFRLEVAELLRNRSFLTLFACSVLFFSGLGVAGSLGLHLGTFFWRFSASQMQEWTLAVPVGFFLGVPLAAIVVKIMEKRTALVIGMAFVGFGVSLPPVLRVYGLLPLDGGALSTLLIGTNFATGAVAALAGISIAAMLADAIDEHEYLFNARREGLFFAALTFAAKASAGVGSLVAGLVLQAIDFPSGVTKLEQASNLPQHTIDLLGLFAGPISGSFFFGSAVACTLYRLDSKKHSAILRSLRARASGVDARSSPQEVQI